MAAGSSSPATIVRRALDELLNARRLDAIDEYWAPDVVDHSPGDGQRPGREGIRFVVSRYLEHDPTLRVSLDEVIADGEKVLTKETWSGEDGRLTRFHLFIVRDGMIVEEWSASSAAADPPTP